MNRLFTDEDTATTVCVKWGRSDKSQAIGEAWLVDIKETLDGSTDSSDCTDTLPVGDRNE